MSIASSDVFPNPAHLYHLASRLATASAWTNTWRRGTPSHTSTSLKHRKEFQDRHYKESAAKAAL
jgi:hypothetical protein